MGGEEISWNPMLSDGDVSIKNQKSLVGEGKAGQQHVEGVHMFTHCTQDAKVPIMLFQGTLTSPLSPLLESS